MSFISASLCLLLVGLVFVIFLAKNLKYKCSAGEILPLAFLVSLGVVTCQLFIYHLLGIGFDFWKIFLPIALVVGVGGFWVTCGRTQQPCELVTANLEGPQAKRAKLLANLKPIERMLLAGIVIQVLWVFFLVLPTPIHSHDAVANYALKAKIFYFANGIPEDFFVWSEKVVAHPDYPLFLPLVMTWIYKFTHFNELTVNLVMPVLYISFLALFYVLTARFFKRTYSLLATFILATIPQVADYATIIHVDLILAAFVGCAFLYFMLYIRHAERVYLIFSSILFGFSLHIKNEAVVFAACFLIVLVIFRKSRDILIPIVIMGLIALPWFGVRIFSGAEGSDITLNKITFARVWQNVRDIPVFLNLFQQEVFGPKKWNIFWPLVFGCLIWKRKDLLKDEVFYMTLFLLLSSAGYFAGYMLTSGANLYFYVNTTISRFMLHFAPIWLFYAAYLIHER